MVEVTATYIERFNRAASLSRAGNFEEALKAFRRIFEPLPRGETGHYSDRFKATAAMREAWVLMDLERYEEALTRINEARSLAHVLDDADLYELWFSYGNILGNLKRPGAARALREAARIAEEELLDTQRCARSWMFILHWLKAREDWAALEKVMFEAHLTGIRIGSIELQLRAGDVAPYAWRGVGKIDRARDGAKKALQRLVDAGVTDERLEEWRGFLRNLRTTPEHVS